MRRLTGAMATVFALIDIAAEAPVAAETWSDPAVRTIRQHAIDIVCWDNDLISWRKEATAANSVNNLVAVLVAAGLSTPQAVSRIVDMRNQAVVAVVALSQDLIARQQEHLTALVRGLQAWISGALAYSTHSTRYSAMPDL
jgi:5-epi-alpha-selinene synthase